MGRGAATDSDMTGGSACEVSAWKSNSGVECKLSAGVGGGSPMRRGQGLPVVVTFGLQQGSRTQAWCYDAAVVSSAGGSTNGPSSGSTSVTVAGFSFGSWGYSGRVRVGRGASIDTDNFGFTSIVLSAWISSSVIHCKVFAGVGFRHSVHVSVGSMVGSVSNIFSFDKSSVFLLPLSLPSTGSLVVSSVAAGCGSFGYSPRSSLGLSDCLFSSWLSDSALSCKMSSHGSWFSPDIFVSVSNIQSFRSQAFNFAANAMLRSLSSNISSAPVILSVVSGNYSNVTNSTMASGNATYTQPCNVSTSNSSLTKNSSNALNCTEAVKSSAALNSSGINQSTQDNNKTYWPFLCQNCSLIKTNNVPTTAANFLAIAGINYSPADSSIKARFSSSASVSRWFSDSMLVARVAAGRQGLIFTVATVNMQKGMDDSTLISFDLFNLSPDQLISLVPSTGGISITSLGSNFGVVECSLSVSLQRTVSESSVWNSHSSIQSKSAAIITNQPILSISVGLNISRFVFAARVPSSLHTSNDYLPKSRPVTGASLIVLLGAHFGFYNPSLKTSIGVSNCEQSRWLSGTQLMCKLPLGYSQRPDFKISLLNVQKAFQLLPTNTTLSRPVFLNAKPLQRAVFLSWNNSGPGQPKSVSVFDSVDGTLTISSVALFLQSNPFIILPADSLSFVYNLVIASQLYIVFHFDFEISFGVILGKPAPFAAPLQIIGQPTGNLRSTATWKFLDANEAPFSRWTLRAVDSKNTSKVVLETIVLDSNT